MPRIKVYSSDNYTKKRTIYRRYEKKPYNFMKWWRVVRYWAKRKYEISLEDLEVILYLYDNDLFTKKEFLEFNGLLQWDKTRFQRLMSSGYIVTWREHKGYSRQAKLYTLSVKAKRICDSVYKKLTQEEHIPENKQNNPIFSGNGYADKMYRKAIMAMNKERDKRLREEEERKLGIIE